MSNINGISPNDVKTRINDINRETPWVWTNVIKSPQELTVRTAARNNIMLEQTLINQTKIMSNQEEIMKKLGVGNQLSVSA